MGSASACCIYLPQPRLWQKEPVALACEYLCPLLLAEGCSAHHTVPKHPPTLSQSLLAAECLKASPWRLPCASHREGDSLRGSQASQPSLLLQSLWIAFGSLEAAAPCQGPGRSSCTHALLPAHIIPQLSIWRSKYAIFSLPCNFPCCGCQSSWEM